MVYELCTTPMDDLVRWTFQTFDHDRSGAISTDEFKELCKLVSKCQRHTKKSARYVGAKYIFF